MEHYHPKLISATANKDVLEKYVLKFKKKCTPKLLVRTDFHLTSGVENNANHSGFIIERNPLINAAV